LISLRLLSSHFKSHYIYIRADAFDSFCVFVCAVTRNPALDALLRVPGLAIKQGGEFLTATRLTDPSGASVDQVFHDRKEVIRQGVKLVYVRWDRVRTAVLV
jgi:hypothetical protein